MSTECDVMHKNVQQKKTPPAVLKVLAALKKRETDLMKQLERVRSKMTEVSKLAKPVVVQNAGDALQPVGVPTCKFVGEKRDASIDHVVPIERPVKSHKEALITALRYGGGYLKMDELCSRAIRCGAKTRAKDPKDPLHAVLCRNPDIFEKQGGGYWSFTADYRDKISKSLTRNEVGI